MANLITKENAEKYLKNSQVFFRKSIVNKDTLLEEVEADKVHQVGEVEINRINEDRVAFHIEVNGNEHILYEYKTDLELFAWIRTNLIPVRELVNFYYSK